MKTQLITTLIVLTIAYSSTPANAQIVIGPTILAQQEADAERRAEEQKRQDEIAQQRRERLDVLLEPWLNQPESNADEITAEPQPIWPQPIFQSI